MLHSSTEAAIHSCTLSQRFCCAQRCNHQANQGVRSRHQSVLNLRHCIGDISYRPLTARLNAASDVYPTRFAISEIEARLYRSHSAARSRRQVVR